MIQHGFWFLKTPKLLKDNLQNNKLNQLNKQTSPILKKNTIKNTNFVNFENFETTSFLNISILGGHELRESQLLRHGAAVPWSPGDSNINIILVAAQQKLINNL